MIILIANVLTKDCLDPIHYVKFNFLISLYRKLKIQKLIGKIAHYKKNQLKILIILLLQVEKCFVLFVNQKEDKV